MDNEAIENSPHISANERALMDYAKRYAGKPFISPAEQQEQPQPTLHQGNRAMRWTPEGGAQELNPQRIGRDLGNTGVSMSGAVAYDVDGLLVKVGGVEMSQAQAKAGIKRGWYSQGDFDAALAEARAPYEGSSSFR